MTSSTRLLLSDKLANSLNDLVIRSALELRLLARKPSPRALIHELRVKRGNAIADIAAVYKTVHCFEIKGQTDSVGRVLRQASYYNKAFKRITLVTTKNHVAWAQVNSPSFWGVMVATNSRHGITFDYLRPTKVNPFFSKECALEMLWRNELEHLVAKHASLPARVSDTREQLIRKLSDCCSDSLAEVLVAETLLLRHRSKGP